MPGGVTFALSAGYSRWASRPSISASFVSREATKSEIVFRWPGSAQLSGGHGTGRDVRAVRCTRPWPSPVQPRRAAILDHANGCRKRSTEPAASPTSTQPAAPGAIINPASVQGCGGNWIDAGAWAGPEGGVAARRASPGTGWQTWGGHRISGLRWSWKASTCPKERTR